MHKLRVGYTCNIRDNCKAEDERYSEWEPPETVEAVVTALVDAGCEVSVIDVGPDIFHVLERRRSELDLIFNNAEGLEEGELREAIVPFCCEQLGIPHTGSTPKTFINALDKATAKRLVAYDGVTTPRFQVMRSAGDPLRPDLAFPLMVKPDREGTSIGITQASKVYDGHALRTQVERILDTYHQPALVEEFIDGTEYTIGLVGSYVLPILAVDLTKIPGQPLVRDVHVKEIDTAFSGSLSFDAAPDRYRAFAAAAVRAHVALEALDYNRMDFRARDGALHFLEANPIPGIDPATSDLPAMARRAGVSHGGLIAMILYEAVRRYATRPAHARRFAEAHEHLGEIVAAQIGALHICDDLIWRGNEYHLVRERCDSSL
jgi:D-alanine-D-alanine ligase